MAGRDMATSIEIHHTTEVGEGLVRRLRESLSGGFACPVVMGGVFSMLPDDYHPGRRQYQALSLLRRFRSIRRSPALLAVTMADLFAPGVGSVFGEADRAGQCAIVSLARLQAPYYGFPLTEARLDRRLLVEAVHELGHLRGLGHCPRRDCAMHLSRSLDDTDDKHPAFCPSCRRLLESA